MQARCDEVGNGIGWRLDIDLGDDFQLHHLLGGEVVPRRKRWVSAGVPDENDRLAQRLGLCAMPETLEPR